MSAELAKGGSAVPQDIDVLVSEVGPRDGLQSIKRTMPTEAKLKWIEALAASGLREIEVGSFVSKRLLPQMADCATLVREANKLAFEYLTKRCSPVITTGETTDHPGHEDNQEADHHIARVP